MEALLQEKTKSQGIEVNYKKNKKQLSLTESRVELSSIQRLQVAEVARVEGHEENEIARKQIQLFAAKAFYIVRWILQAMVLRPRLVRCIEPGRFEVVEENYPTVSTKF